MLLGIFNSTTDAMKFLQTKEPITGDRILILGSEQTTHEYNDWAWKNINGLYLQGEKGQDWLDWKPWKDAKEIDTVSLLNQLYEKLKLDEAFAKKVRGEKWEDGKRWEKGEDAQVDIDILVNLLIEKLINYSPFLEKIKGTDGRDWKDWTDWLPWTPGKDGKNWENGDPWLDWRDGWSVVLIENPNNVELFDKELWIDREKNIYIKHNNSLLKI